MKYLTRTEYKGLNLIGQQVEIPAGVYCDTQDNIICWQRYPVCYINSQIARDYFIWADDGQELRRLKYENDIWFNKPAQEYDFETPVEHGDGTTETIIVRRISKYSAEEIRFLTKNYSKYLESAEVILFNNAFYQAPIDDLEAMAKYFRY